jgi:predicted amidohydrolase YtcJ
MRVRFPPLLLAAALASGGGAQAAELLVDHVNGYTLDGAGHLQRFEALLIDDGKVVATGTHDALSGRARNTTVIDGKGRTLLPGLIDAHGHVMALGELGVTANLTTTTSLDAAIADVKAFAKAHPGDAWVQGRGWNQVVWKLGRFPTAKELDQAVADRPAWMSRVDGHAGWANSAAMKLAGIDRNTKDPTGGRIERDAEGNPTGVFVDGAMALVESKIPPPTDAQLSARLDAALRTWPASASPASAMPASARRTSRATSGTPMQASDRALYGMISGTGAEFDAISKDGPLIGYGHDFLTVRSVKLYADGALGSRGAAMLAPYSDDPGNSGLLFETNDAMTAMIGKALSKGYQVNVHAIGDKGNRQVLDAFEAAYKAHGGKDLRNRIEHAQVVSLEDIPASCRCS